IYTLSSVRLSEMNRFGVPKQKLKMGRHGIKQVRLFSNDENGLFEARTLFSKDPRVVYKLGDVRDHGAVESAMVGCDIAFHAAALKHVNFCEENPYEAVSVNILGTQNVIDQSVKKGVERFVFISTDKAVNPANTMGATKLLGEKLTLDASKISNKGVFCCVRFGNVIGTRGSVVRIFEKQVKEGDSVTVKNEEMTRFIMLPSEASKLVLRAGERASSGDTFVLKMPAVRLGDLAKASMEFFAALYGKDAKSMKIRRLVPNPEEKIHEELMTSAEAGRAIKKDEFFIIPYPKDSFASVQTTKKMRNCGYTSNSVPLLNVGEISSLLARLYW
ncbi:MAG: polysaccharide biosynthesis protein, partial [Nitrososphaerota archaeon]|nr:polysaccharide biosynthesis protein [Nitrososphaerota archaeon]